MGDLLGKPIVVVPYKTTGCLANLWAFLSTWLIRLLFALAFFAAGYGCAVMRQ